MKARQEAENSDRILNLIKDFFKIVVEVVVKKVASMILGGKQLKEACERELEEKRIKLIKQWERNIRCKAENSQSMLNQIK